MKLRLLPRWAFLDLRGTPDSRAEAQRILTHGLRPRSRWWRLPAFEVGRFGMGWNLGNFNLLPSGGVIRYDGGTGWACFLGKWFWRWTPEPVRLD